MNTLETKLRGMSVTSRGSEVSAELSSLYQIAGEPESTSDTLSVCQHPTQAARGRLRYDR